MILGNMVSIYAYLDTDEVGFFRGQGFKEMPLNGCTWLSDSCAVGVAMVNQGLDTMIMLFTAIIL